MAFIPFPAGTVLAFAGSTAPSGWLLCDGTSYNRDAYGDLFAAIGTAHGTASGSTFNVPDYRGRFLRGVDGSANRDPDKTSRTAAATGGNTGNNVGSVQGGATAKNGLANAASSLSALTMNSSSISTSVGNQSQNHAHTVSHAHNQNYMNAGGGPGAIAAPVNGWTIVSAGGSSGGMNVSTENVTPTSAGVSADHNHSVSGTAAAQTLSSSTVAAQTITGDNETRPTNSNVNYIIKI